MLPGPMRAESSPSPPVVFSVAGYPEAMASWPFMPAGAALTSTWETLYCGEVNPLVASIVFAPGTFDLLSLEARTMNQATAKKHVYAELITESIAYN